MSWQEIALHFKDQHGGAPLGIVRLPAEELARERVHTRRRLAGPDRAENRVLVPVAVDSPRRYTGGLDASHVDDTGRVTFPPDSVVNAAPIPMGDDTCGTITPAPTMLTFSGTTARFLQTATSDGCGNVEIVGTLTRQ